MNFRQYKDKLYESDSSFKTIEDVLDKVLDDAEDKEAAIKYIEDLAKKDDFVAANIKELLDFINSAPDKLFKKDEECEEDEDDMDETIDWDTIDELYESDDFEIEEDELSDEEVDEAIKFKKVVRAGKVIRKKTDSRAGYKIVGGKSIRMSAQEKMHRKIAQKKASRKRKSKSAISSIKRRKSMKKSRRLR